MQKQKEKKKQLDVVGVRFKKAGKIYYFAPGGIEIKQGDNVIVETVRGLEFGEVIGDPRAVPEDEIVAPLKNVIRIADENDLASHLENVAKKERAMKLCQEKIEKNKLDMKLTDVEYTFDNNKIIFYFTADGRVDFRELVKDLASVFKMRIELRQIGVRDEAKMLGGIGTCGKGLCCHTWLPDFEPVSIKMAKVQNLSLNPSKISGICGRLMCCLKYENDTYHECRRGMPDVGEKIKTEDGIGIVIDTNILANRIKVRLIVEENDGDSKEKLSSDVYTYRKEKIRRLGNKCCKETVEISAEEITDDLKELLED